MALLCESHRSANCSEIQCVYAQCYSSFQGLKGSVLTRIRVNQERTVKQVQLPPLVKEAMKAFAVANQIEQQKVVDDAISWFLKEKKGFGTTLFYYSSASSGGKSKSTTLWILSAIADKTAALSEKEEIAENRIIFTAIVYFLQVKGYLQIPPFFRAN